jgi:2,4-dienoyl-CoA reductase-like NADH-dependent reductase (Old Yellow Enzyme family)
MISEATPVAETGHGYPCTPGIHTDAQARSWGRAVAAAGTDATRRKAQALGAPALITRSARAQVEAWKPVVKAVHDKGAFIFCQARTAQRGASQLAPRNSPT